MRRVPILIAILLAAFSVPAQDDSPRVIQWERIYSWKNSNTKAYVDTKSLSVKKDNSKDYKIGMILFYKDAPVEMEVHNETVVANIFASYYIADCEQSKIATMSDFYFNLDRLPVSTDEPLLAFDYTDNITDVVNLERSDPILTTLCPTYI